MLAEMPKAESLILTNSPGWTGGVGLLSSRTAVMFPIVSPLATVAQIKQEAKNKQSVTERITPLPTHGHTREERPLQFTLIAENKAI
jgi:hypothetical protein